MKDKIKIVVLILVFIILLFLCNNILNKQEELSINNIISDTNYIKNESIDLNQNIMNSNQEDEINISEDDSMSGKVLEVTSESFQKEVLESENTVLIDFYADWCGPCKRLSPIVEELAEEEKNVKFVKINIDDNEDIAIEYQVMSIPTLVVIKNGKEANRSVGLIDKSRIQELIK